MLRILSIRVIFRLRGVKMKKKFKVLVWIVSILTIVLAVSLGAVFRTNDVLPASSNNIVESTLDNKKEFEETTITIGSTGDILIHSPIFRSVYNSENGTYDFDNIFKYVNDIYSSYDLMVADLEQPLGGEEKGYSGFPLFNAPDSIADALKNNGVDLLLTANNHCYDQSSDGFYRTMSVLKERQIEFIGSREVNDKPYIVKDVNGIKVGMINYTYETEALTDTKYINGIPMNSETAPLLNSFNYSKLDEFYSEFQTNMNNMYADGADVIIAYMHWGEEYSLSANDYQKKIAQKLCDFGVDAIVGGHTHCIEPTDLLYSEISGKQTPIIYSTGNQLSNQRKETLSKFTYNTPYFEDGVIYELSFKRKADGSVVLSDVSYTATWCNLFDGHYRIIPLDDEHKSSVAHLGRTTEMKNSLKRTKSLLDEGIKKFKNEYEQVDLRNKLTE